MRILQMITTILIKTTPLDIYRNSFFFFLITCFDNEENKYVKFVEEKYEVTLHSRSDR